jgi:alanine racemase
LAGGCRRGCGYADGFLKQFNTGYVYIKNKKYKIVGKIAMDIFMVKVDKTIKYGDKVLIIKNNKHLDEYLKKNDADQFTFYVNLNPTRVKRTVINRFHKKIQHTKSKSR